MLLELKAVTLRKTKTNEGTNIRKSVCQTSVCYLISLIVLSSNEALLKLNHKVFPLDLFQILN